MNPQYKQFLDSIQKQNQQNFQKFIKQSQEIHSKFVLDQTRRQNEANYRRLLLRTTERWR